MIKNKTLPENLIFSPQILLFCALYSNKYKKEMSNKNLNLLSKSELNKKMDHNMKNIFKIAYIGNGPISNFHIPALKANKFKIQIFYYRKIQN